MNQEDEDNDFNEDDDIIDVDSGDDYVDDGDVSDDDMDFMGDSRDLEKGGGLKFKKLALPILLLVIALGAGGYVVLNPQILGGGKDISSASSSVPPVVESTASGLDSFPSAEQQDVPPVVASDITENKQENQADGNEATFLPDLPQPSVSMNETPGMPEIPFPDSEKAVDISAEARPVQQEEQQAGDQASQDTQAPVSEERTEASLDFEQPLSGGQEDDASAASLSAETEQGSVTQVEQESELQAEQQATPGDVPVIAQQNESPEGKSEPDVTQTEPVFETATASSGEEPAEVPTEPVVETVADSSAMEPPEMPVFEESVDTQPFEAQNSPSADSSDISQGVSSAGVSSPSSAGDENTDQPQDVTTSQTESPALPSPSGTVAPAADTFYDGRVATGAMAGTSLRKVDPELEPASQFVVVKKAYEATDMEALLVSANRALKLKRYESALDMFDQLYEKNNRDIRILMGRAVAQQHSGLLESAIRSYEEILEISPDNADAMLNMLGLLKQEYPSVALRRLIDLQQKHPNNAGVSAQIGLTYADMGNNDEAVRYLQRAATQEPHSAQHVFNLAIISDRLGDSRQAISYYEKALELDAVYSSGRSIPREVIYSRLADLRRR